MYKIPPEGFTLFGLTIKFYGVLISFAILLGVFLVWLFAKKRGLKASDMIDVALIVVPLAIVCARILYVLTSGYKYTFVEALQIWKGGLSIYGAVMGGALGVLIASKVKKIGFLELADIIMPVVLLGQAIGRWGNFFNQEAYGIYVGEGSFPFSVYIEHCHQALCTCGGSGWHMACFFWEFIFDLLGAGVLITLIYTVKDVGFVTGTYFVWYGIVRAAIEPFRLDPLWLGGARFSLILSICAIIIGVGILTYSIIKLIKKKKGAKNV